MRRRTTASSATARASPEKYAGVTGSADETAGTARRSPAGRRRVRPAGTSRPAIQSTALSRVKYRAAHARRSSGVIMSSPHSG
nr:hypothetical protein GCM10020092_069610 [Actinoplanes digitatis]